MKAKTFDKKFDDGQDITKYLDLSKARRSCKDQVNIDNKDMVIGATRKRD